MNMTRIRERKDLSSSNSSITAAHSLASSQDSSTCTSFSAAAPPPPRCRGLDLLVKAIHQVNAGSVVGVPYIQRRVTIRRRRRSHLLGFDAFLFDGLRHTDITKNSKKPKRNLDRLSSDSVFQSWRTTSDLC